MFVQGQIGVTNLGDSNTSLLRQGRTSELVISVGHPRFAESTKLGTIFSLTLHSTLTGISAGNLVNAAAAAATQFAVWNPRGSGVNLSILKFRFQIISATTLPTNIFHGLFVNGVPTINTTYDSGKNAANARAAGVAPRAKYVATAAQAGTTLTNGSAPVVLRQAPVAFSATTFSSARGTDFVEQVDGDIVLPPGTGWLPLWSGAGSSVLNAYSVTWAEVPN